MLHPRGPKNEGGGIPGERIREVNGAPVRTEGAYVLYWMIAARRTRHSFALDRALEWARELGLGLVVLEALRLDYPWASPRLHTFVLEGMRDNAAAFDPTPVRYFPYVERRPGEGKGLLEALAASAAVVVTDDFPTFFLPRMVKRAGARLSVRLEAIDGNGLYPLRATERIFTTAASFRRHLQKVLPPHLEVAPRPAPLRRLRLPAARLPAGIAGRWKEGVLDPSRLATLPLDATVLPAPLEGGSRAATRALRDFLDRRLCHYATRRNEPEADAQSHLSPYLHFGHISAHEVFEALTGAVDWTPDRLAPRATGSRSGWWGTTPEAEAFLDQLITWRELGHNRCAHDPAAAAYRTLPDWARRTLDHHRDDPRQHVYPLARFEAARTHDPLWNAAQRQLVREGTIHNYLRMLWGKKILEWSRTPRGALRVMLTLNDRYALDGRDPNSISGIFWVLGRYDRAWGPERPIFGKVRYMSSANTARKVRLQAYLERHGPE